jgi:23S rRNA (pseudouridine1915-N3)-methyltransferase
MKIIIYSPGDKPKGAEKELLDDYLSRISKRFKVELFSKEPKDLKESDFVIVLDENGLSLSNLEFSKRFEEVTNSGRYKRLVFVIGEAYGVDDDIKLRGDLIWSFSKQVFPHRLFRIMLAEQIYRTLEIINGSPYHHE